MLIRNAEIWGSKAADLRIDNGKVAAIGHLDAHDGEQIIDAGGALLLPGLHDHHIHLAALAARRASVFCGPPIVSNETELADALSQPGKDWLRAIGYHDSVAGMLDMARIDEMVCDRPVRIQHRSGRMWFFNSIALELLLKNCDVPPGLDLKTGRLFDEDPWLRRALGSTPPDFAELSRDLARWGVTGITDMTPANDPAIAAHFAAQQKRGLLQNVVLAGQLDLAEVESNARLNIGPAKMHLHESQMPDYDASLHFIRTAHEQRRTVAIHCVSEVELVFALALLEEAGAATGDRIEHASVTPDHLVMRIAKLDLQICSQPNFIAERGDQYLTDVEAEDIPHLYRLQSFLDVGVTLAAGSDAPFGSPDPWAAMAAAVDRKTYGGDIIGASEALSADAALRLFLADPNDLKRERSVQTGANADLILLDRDWNDAASDLSSVAVQMTMTGGSIVHHGIDKPPFERDFGADSPPREDHQCCALTSNPV